jgi:Arc/MetJ-type ribon-helix-helix transcriptional regulator
LVCFSLVATEQIAVRLPEEQLAVLDDLVARGVYDTRAAAVRAGIEAILEADRRGRVDREVVAGYTRTPPTEGERAAAMASMGDAIAEVRCGGGRSKASDAARFS